MVQAPQSLMAESIRELRTSLRVILDDTPCPVIVVTSPEPGDGKTFVAANLAAAWAMSGSKVIVVSADFRRPRLEEIFGLPRVGRPGLADLIRSNWKTPEPDPSGPGVAGRPGTADPRLREPSHLDGTSGAQPYRPRVLPPVRSLVGGRPPGGQRHLGPPGPAGRDPAREPQRAVRQPGDAAGHRPAAAAGRHRPAGHPAGAGRAGHRHPREHWPSGRWSWRPRAGPTATTSNGPCNGWRPPTAGSWAWPSTGCAARRPTPTSPTPTSNDHGRDRAGPPGRPQLPCSDPMSPPTSAPMTSSPERRPPITSGRRGGGGGVRRSRTPRRLSRHPRRAAPGGGGGQLVRPGGARGERASRGPLRRSRSQPRLRRRGQPRPAPRDSPPAATCCC